MKNKLIDDEATIWKTNSLMMRQLYEKQTHWLRDNYMKTYSLMIRQLHENKLIDDEATTMIISFAFNRNIC